MSVTPTSAKEKRPLLSRRTFLVHGGWVVALGIFVYQVGRFLGAPGLDAGPPVVVEAGNAQSYAYDRPLYVSQARAWVRRDAQGLQALDAVCPHLGCIVRQAEDVDEFYCPCHGSRFAADGVVLEGPAESNLRPLRVEVDGERVFLWSE